MRTVVSRSGIALLLVVSACAHERDGMQCRIIPDGRLDPPEMEMAIPVCSSDARALPVPASKEVVGDIVLSSALSREPPSDATSSGDWIACAMMSIDDGEWFALPPGQRPVRFAWNDLFRRHHARVAISLRHPNQPFSTYKSYTIKLSKAMTLEESVRPNGVHVRVIVAPNVERAATPETHWTTRLESSPGAPDGFDSMESIKDYVVQSLDELDKRVREARVQGEVIRAHCLGDLRTKFEFLLGMIERRRGDRRLAMIHALWSSAREARRESAQCREQR